MNIKLEKLLNELFIYTVTIREVIKDTMKARAWKEEHKKLRAQIIREKSRLLSDNPDLASTIAHIQKSGTISVFNADFESKYTKAPDVFYDPVRKLKYVMHNGQKLYYPRLWRSSKIREMVNSIWCEQDIKSPHRYLDEGESLKDYVVFDCGSAEANFALDVARDAKAVYLFEGDSSWKRPLKATFTDYTDKVTLKNRFIGKKEGNVLSLREYMEYLVSKGKLNLNNDRIFIKMDIEGHEIEVLEDIMPLIRQAKHMELAVCLYHNQGDEETVRKLIPKDCSVRVRDGYMLFLWDDKEIPYPYFRHGIMRISKGR